MRPPGSSSKTEYDALVEAIYLSKLLDGETDTTVRKQVQNEADKELDEAIRYPCCQLA